MRAGPVAAVSVDGLTVRFGEVTALDAVSFSLPAGAYLAVGGPNGSGKSTLLRALLGLVSADEGSIRLFGEPPMGCPAGVAYVPQAKTLDRRFPGTALELVVSGLRRHWPWKSSKQERDMAREALRLVDAERLLNRRVAILSGGELQRVYLARAAIRRPRLVLLDEPATGVDFVGEEIVYRVLDSWRKTGETTIIMVTHDLAVAFHHASHVLLLNRRLVAFGPPEEMLTERNLQHAYGHMGHRYNLAVWEGDVG
jgi:zinc transport system ATP-binding protein